MPSSVTFLFCYVFSVSSHFSISELLAKNNIITLEKYTLGIRLTILGYLQEEISWIQAFQTSLASVQAYFHFLINFHRCWFSYAETFSFVGENVEIRKLTVHRNALERTFRVHPLNGPTAHRGMALLRIAANMAVQGR